MPDIPKNIQEQIERALDEHRAKALAARDVAKDNPPALWNELKAKFRPRPSIDLTKINDSSTDISKAQENISNHNREVAEKALADARKHIDRLELMLAFKPWDGSIKHQIATAEKSEQTALKTLADIASMDARTTSDGVVSRSFGTPKFDNPNS